MSHPLQKRFGKIHLRNISPKTWEHPTDRAALSALESIPGIDTVVRKFVGLTTEKSLRLIALASAVRVSEQQFPKLYNLHREACSILDVTQVPELYVANNPFMNAGAIGVENPFIMLNSSMIEQLNDEEILAVIGHELGHCLSGHALYKTLLHMLIILSMQLSSIPLSGVAIWSIILALKEWDRKSELSADRAGLLVVQDPVVYYSLLMKMAGGANYSEMNTNEFFQQAYEYENSNELSDSIHKMINLVNLSHPFPVLRLTELKSWVDCGEMQKILSQQYTVRGGEDSHFENARSAASNYYQDMEDSNDPFAKIGTKASAVFDSISEETEEIQIKAGEFFDSIFGNTDHHHR